MKVLPYFHSALTLLMGAFTSGASVPDDFPLYFDVGGCSSSDKCMEAVENAHQEALRAERLQNRLDIQGQIRYNEARARFQEDEKIREGIFARQMESDYQAQIKKVFETSEPKTYYPRSHTKWFT